MRISERDTGSETASHFVLISLGELINMKTLLSNDYEVIVIGGGEAALSAAIAAREEGVSVAIMSKGKIGYGGSSVIANAVHSAIFSTGDSPDIFYQDIIKGSRYITDKTLARVLAEECTTRVDELESKYKVHLEREMKVSTPGHSFPRRVYAGRGHGRNITKALADYAHEIGVHFHEQSTLIDLFSDHNSVHGVLIEKNRMLTTYFASSIILATGGFGSLYASSDNTRDVSGEGIGIAFRHGANLVDMEFVQFYPYRLKEPANIDVLTKIFAKGAYLINEANGRFMEKFPKKELETRDILCFEMFKQDRVFLNFSQIPEDILEQDSPDLYRFYKKGYSGKWLMQPVQHYCMGGIQIDEWGRTSLSGLFACGECSGGLHGANRLAGGSLSEALVFGARAGRMAAKESRPTPTMGGMDIPVQKQLGYIGGLTKTFEQGIIRKVKEIMWSKVGIERSTGSLEEAAKQLGTIIFELEEMKDRSTLFLADKIRTAWVASYAGAAREESRGAHQLQNIKEEKKEWEKKNVIQIDHFPFFQRLMVTKK